MSKGFAYVMLLGEISHIATIGDCDMRGITVFNDAMGITTSHTGVGVPTKTYECVDGQTSL